jgi:hypothetical protein
MVNGRTGFQNYLDETYGGPGASGNPLAAKLFANAQLLALTFAWDLGYGRPEWFAGIVPRTAADYIAGMTDRYAILEHRRLFDPSERT